MNLIKLNKMIEKYIENFALLNEESTYNESFKWKAVVTFQQNWDLRETSEGFAEMLQKSCKDASVLLDTGNRHPLISLIQVIKNSDKEKAVHEEFKTLFAVLAKPAYIKLPVIKRFINNCNSLIEEENKGKHGWKWDQHTVMAIMAMADPKNNCFYKTDEIKNLLVLLNVQDNIKSGSSFMLSKYEEFFKQLKSELVKNSKVLELNKELLTEKSLLLDDDNNVLVWDFINATKYDFINK